MKVFGIGLSRTGTTSLSDALNILGINTIHMPNDSKTCIQLMEGNFHLDVLNEYAGITDVMGAGFFPQFDECYPGSKFILTTRDKKKWLESVERLFRRPYRYPIEALEGNGQPTFQSGRDFSFSIGPGQHLDWCVYGISQYHESRFSYIYDRHHAEVARYFKDRPDDLLVLNCGDGWEPLCKFLNKEIPTRSYPHSNRNQSAKYERHQKLFL